MRKLTLSAALALFAALPFIGAADVNARPSGGDDLPWCGPVSIPSPWCKPNPVASAKTPVKPQPSAPVGTSKIIRR